jgi:hypothetical protein
MASSRAAVFRQGNKQYEFNNPVEALMRAAAAKG